MIRAFFTITTFCAVIVVVFVITAFFSNLYTEEQVGLNVYEETLICPITLQEEEEGRVAPSIDDCLLSDDKQCSTLIPSECYTTIRISHIKDVNYRVTLGNLNCSKEQYKCDQTRKKLEKLIRN